MSDSGKPRLARWAQGLILGGFVFDLLVVLPFLWHLNAARLDGWRLEVADFLGTSLGRCVGFAVAFGPMLLGALFDRLSRRMRARADGAVVDDRVGSP